MKNHFVLISFLLILYITGSYADLERKVYIVYLGEHTGDKTIEEIEDHHHTYLHSVRGSREEAKASILYSYKNIINGFSALLTPDEAATLSEMEGVVSVFHSRPGEYKLHTTRSWDFINLLEGNGNPTSLDGEELLRKASYGKDVVVGVLDSGIWPESQSFNDEGMEPVPSWWKGSCEPGGEFTRFECNRKIIGARYYLKGYETTYRRRLDGNFDYRSPRDVDGHGTHTASTIGGRRVANVSAIGGFANGTVSGGAPLVRLAIYKVCWSIPGESLAEGNVCLMEDIIAAFDDAVNDGVQVISVSLGANSSIPYLQDGVAIGSLHAMKRDIVVVCSAGNDGPDPMTVTNVAPWLITVGASSIDRLFTAPVVLGNGMTVQGQTVAPFTENTTYPLVYAGDVEIPGTTTDSTSGLCYPDTLSPELVQGAVVLCLQGYIFQAYAVKQAGAAAAILGNPFGGNEILVKAHALPETSVFLDNTTTIFNYTRDTFNPTAKLIPAKTVIGTNPAPVMAPFSSTGPSLIEPNILKPDITAPGLNILAAWSEASSPTKLPDDDRVVKYNIDSGTSMSCPHVSAVAALLKAIHPDWSSAAIRSALMTTARLDNNMGRPITDAIGNVATPFQIGAGHLQPSKASDPGLVYDATYTDYLLFLCSSGYDNVDPGFRCPSSPPSQSNLNYPSLAIANLKGSMTVNRTVTNVGKSDSKYSVKIAPPDGYTVQIDPTALNFSQLGEKHSFTITITTQNNATKNLSAFGWYTWSDGIHEVRSPIAVTTTSSSSALRLVNKNWLVFVLSIFATKVINVK